METILDIPEILIEKARLKAEQRGVNISSIVAEALEKNLQSADLDLVEHRKKVEKLFAAFDKFQTDGPIGKFNRADCYDRPALRRN